jgi:hypothetical protein
MRASPGQLCVAADDRNARSPPAAAIARFSSKRGQETARPIKHIFIEQLAKTDGIRR